MKLRGSFEAHPERAAARQGEPEPKEGIGEPLDWLNAAQQACWRELVHQVPAGVLTSMDRWWLEIACRLMAEYRATGQLTGSQMSCLQNALGKMGLNPVERSKVRIDGKKPKDEDEKFFGGQQAPSGRAKVN